MKELHCPACHQSSSMFSVMLLHSFMVSSFLRQNQVRERTDVPRPRARPAPCPLFDTNFQILGAIVAAACNFVTLQDVEALFGHAAPPKQGPITRLR